MKKLLIALLTLCFLLSPALAEQFAPQNALDGKMQALDCLQYSSFGAEYNSTNSLLKRWESDIKIYTCGAITDKDSMMLDDFIMQLSFRCPFLPRISRTNTESAANVVIYYGPLDTLKDHVPNYVEDNWGFFTYKYNGDYEIYQAQIAIASDVTRQRQRNHLVMEELIGTLGLANDHNLYSDSIVYAPWTETQELSDIDWLMMNMLYHPSLSCGMSYQQARGILLNTF